MLPDPQRRARAQTSARHTHVLSARALYIFRTPAPTHPPLCSMWLGAISRPCVHRSSVTAAGAQEDSNLSRPTGEPLGYRGQRFREGGASVNARICSPHCASAARTAHPRTQGTRAQRQRDGSDGRAVDDVICPCGGACSIRFGAVPPSPRPSLPRVTSGTSCKRRNIGMEFRLGT